MYEARRKVFWFAIVSRSAVLLLQLIFNALCPDHDADAFRTPIDNTENKHTLDRLVSFALGGLTRWDAQYYIHIAKYGYTYENTLAFYPLFPWTLSFFASKLRVIPLTFNQTSTIVILGALFNFACFVKAALVLFDLSRRVFDDQKIAYRSAILFCVNPASIFFSALYSESAFALLSFYSMLESLGSNPYVFLPIGLSTLVRSNGLVNIGFPVYMWLRSFIVTALPNYLSENRLYHGNKRTLLFNSRHLLISISQILTVVIASLLPFSALQHYHYMLFCKSEPNATAFPYHVRQHAIDNELLLPAEHEFPWCEARLPIAYSHVQAKYWNVGLFKYYQLKQLPNFVLALPVLYLMLKCIAEYFAQHKSKLWTLEFYTGEAKRRKAPNEEYPLEMFVFAVHGLFLTLFCIFFVHIQVSTRLLCSATPLIYWYCALLSLREAKLSKSPKQLEYESPDNVFSRWKVFLITQPEYSLKEKLIYGYFIGYTIVGCFMFANYLPWT